MKKFDIFKTIQLILFVCLTAFGLFTIFTDSELYHMIATDERIRTLCLLLWVTLGVAFFFIFMDFSLFSSFKKAYRELDFAVYSDPVSGIANRFSCDAIIEKYLDKPLPENIGCIMFDLTNIKEINQQLGHLQGNTLIHDFSAILHSSAQDLCFVGRNGGNKFLALFEDCSEEKMDLFLDRVKERVERHNEHQATRKILYSYGVAFKEDPDINHITSLIALSNSRIYKDL